MEENKDDIIYDLEHAWSAGEVGAQNNSEESESSEVSENAGEVGAQSSEKAAELAPEGAQTDCASGAAVNMTALHNTDAQDNVDNAVNTDNAENTENADSAENTENADSDTYKEEIDRMVEDMGAEALLSIIKGNRNAAIRQIIGEVEAARPRDIPTGSSAASAHSSIFDLAAMA